MNSPLLSLPPELRVRIYELVLCTQGPAALVSPGTQTFRQARLNDGEALPFSQSPAAPYPPSDGDEDDLLEELAARRKSVPNQHLHISPSEPTIGPWTRPPNLSAIEDYGIRFVDGSAETGFDADNKPEETNDSNSVKLDGEDSVSRANSKPPVGTSRYGLVAFPPLNLSLLRVRREVHAEGAPIFYQLCNFVLDTNPVEAIRFLKALPQQALCNITTITLAPAMFQGGIQEVETCWSRTCWSLPRIGDPVMFTPFGAFLNLELPRLRDVYAYMRAGVYGRDRQYGLPFEELERMLCHGRIQRLHYLSMGESAAEVLKQNQSSAATLRALIDAVGSQAARREFDTHHHLPHISDIGDPLEQVHVMARLQSEGWYERQRTYDAWHTELFDWEWSDRGLDLGHTGTVQAIITAKLKKKT